MYLTDISIIIKAFKYFIGYQEGGIVKALCIILPQISGYIKCLKTVVKACLFWWKMIKCGKNLNKFGMWLKSIKFHIEPVYDKTYLKAKVREFDGKIKTKFLVNEVPKENMHYTCIPCITVDSVMRIDKKKSSAGLFRRMQI